MNPTRSPTVYGTVTPSIISRDTARLLDFVAAAFDATELARIISDDGAIGHAEVRIGDSVVMMFDGRPEWPDTPASLRLYVEDGDVHVCPQGARRRRRPGHRGDRALLERGDRVGRVRAPLGNVWWLQDRVADLSAEEIQQRAADPRFVEAMLYLQSGEIVTHQRDR